MAALQNYYSLFSQGVKTKKTGQFLVVDLSDTWQESAEEQKKNMIFLRSGILKYHKRKKLETADKW